VHTKGIENICNKIIAENFPNLEKEMVIQVQEGFRTPSRQDHKQASPWQIIVKTLSIQNEERVLKTAREKHEVTYKGKPIRITADFSTETLKARRTWNYVLQEVSQVQKAKGRRYSLSMEYRPNTNMGNIMKNIMGVCWVGKGE
jgi:hypothetical protein